MAAAGEAGVNNGLAITAINALQASQAVTRSHPTSFCLRALPIQRTCSPVCYFDLAALLLFLVRVWRAIPEDRCRNGHPCPSARWTFDAY